MHFSVVLYFSCFEPERQKDNVLTVTISYLIKEKDISKHFNTFVLWQSREGKLCQDERRSSNTFLSLSWFFCKLFSILFKTLAKSEVNRRIFSCLTVE